MVGGMAMAGQWAPAAVLIVEDEATIAADVRAARADLPDLVLHDMTPGSDGVEVCRRRRPVHRASRWPS
jgi:hypothetical protein